MHLVTANLRRRLVRGGGVMRGGNGLANKSASMKFN